MHFLVAFPGGSVLLLIVTAFLLIVYVPYIAVYYYYKTIKLTKELADKAGEPNPSKETRINDLQLVAAD
jgi:hypothetical protein